MCVRNNKLLLFSLWIVKILMLVSKREFTQHAKCWRKFQISGVTLADTFEWSNHVLHISNKARKIGLVYHHY